MSVQYAIDDVAMEYSAEPVASSSAMVAPVIVYNTRQCITGPGGSQCVPARTYQALSDPSVVATVGNSLNVKALNGLISADNIRANVAQAGSNNTSSINFTGDNNTFAITPSPPLQKVISGVIGKITSVKCLINQMIFGANTPPDGGFTLTSPAVQTITLVSAFAATFTANYLTFIFQDGAALPKMSATNPPISAFYQPDSGTFASMNGFSPNGNWVLTLSMPHHTLSGLINAGFDVVITVDV